MLSYTHIRYAYLTDNDNNNNVYLCILNFGENSLLRWRGVEQINGRECNIRALKDFRSNKEKSQICYFCLILVFQIKPDF